MVSRPNIYQSPFDPVSPSIALAPELPDSAIPEMISAARSAKLRSSLTCELRMRARSLAKGLISSIKASTCSS